jgi:signal transduction histidine kinase
MTRWRWPGTVRSRVTAVATLAVAAVLVVTGVLLVGAQRRVLDEQLDEALAADADRIVARYLDDPASAARDLDPGVDDDTVARITTDDGVVVARSAGERDDDEQYRELVRRFDGPDGVQLEVSVGAPSDDIDEAVRALTVALWVGIPIVTALLAALVWVMVGRTLRPVDLIRAEVAAIGPTELGRRVPVPSGDDEIARLAATMNAMLGRLDASARRQWQFTADASHELRTPLTRLRSEVEVERRHRDDAFVRSVLDEVDGMQRLIDDLLVLARGDEETDAGLRRSVDLDDIVLEEVAALATTGAIVDASRVSAAQLRAAPDQLRRVVRNLLDNAVRHASSRVTVSLSEANGSVVLAVADDGPGIPRDRRDAVFERFRRLDESRSAGTGGTGLGLAIARQIVERHGGTIVVDAGGGAGARFVVNLPAS